jgi:D-threo-aldose 1-dehydrogenase
MDGIKVRKLGRTGLSVTDMGFGASPIGNFLRAISDETANAMILRAWETGMRLFDTAPLYGNGLSELRLGYSLRWRPRDDFILSSKVGRLLTPASRQSIDFRPWVDGAAFNVAFDYSYDGAWRSVEGSLQRMALERIDILLIHDCDVFTHGVEQQKVYFEQAMDGAYRAMVEMRDQGLVGAIGFGVNEWEVCHEALKRGDLDCFLLAGRYTLLEQESLDKFLPLCERRDVAVIIGGGLNSGILATGAVPNAKYNYVTAPPHIMEKVAKIESVCREYSIPLPAAALQFVLAHPAVASHVPGTRTVEQIEQNIAWISHPIPAAFWHDLKRKDLLRADAPTPIEI